MITHCARCGAEAECVRVKEKSRMSDKFRDVWVCKTACPSERVRSEVGDPPVKAKKASGRRVS